MKKLIYTLLIVSLYSCGGIAVASGLGGSSGLGNANPVPSIKDDSNNHIKIGSTNDWAGFTNFADGLQIGHSAIMTSNHNAGFGWYDIIWNGVYSGASYTYLENDVASLIKQNANGITISTATSGSAGDPITWKTAMIIDDNGIGLKSGTSSAYGLSHFEGGGGTTGFATGTAGAEDVRLTMGNFNATWDTRVNGSSGDYEFHDAGTATTWLSISEAGKVTSNKTCATNYTRVTPNYCAHDTAMSLNSLSRDTCTAVASPATDTTFTRVMVEAVSYGKLSAGNARHAQINVYSDASCTNAIDVAYAFGVEITATLGATGSDTARFIAPDVSGSFYLQLTDDSGNGGTGKYWINGYYD